MFDHLPSVGSLPQTLPLHLPGGCGVVGYLALPGGAPADRLVVAIHGSADNARCYAHALGRSAAPKGVAVLAPLFEAPCFMDAEQASDAIFRALKAADPWLSYGAVERFYLAAFGDGSRISLTFALARPNRVRGLCIGEKVRDHDLADRLATFFETV